MEVYLLRHGIAEDTKPGGSDADRALTSDGKKKLRETLRVAAESGVSPDLILSSHLKRAIQTAEIAGDVLAYKNEIVRSESLNPNSSVERVWDEIRTHKDASSLMLVGHNPLFSELAGFLLGSRSSQVELLAPWIALRYLRYRSSSSPVNSWKPEASRRDLLRWRACWSAMCAADWAT